MTMEWVVFGSGPLANRTTCKGEDGEIKYILPSQQMGVCAHRLGGVGPILNCDHGAEFINVGAVNTY